MDAARCLGFNVNRAGVWQHIRSLDSTEKRTLHMTDTLPSDQGLRGLFAGNIGHLTLISESGLYKLIMRSDKDSARPFQDWVTKEALPSIRRTGSYALADHGRELGWPIDTHHRAAGRRSLTRPPSRAPRGR